MPFEAPFDERRFFAVLSPRQVGGEDVNKSHYYRRRTARQIRTKTERRAIFVDRRPAEVDAKNTSRYSVGKRK